MLQRPWRRGGDNIKIGLTNNVCIMYVLGGGYIPAVFYGPVNEFSLEVVQFLDQASDC